MNNYSSEIKFNVDSSILFIENWSKTKSIDSFYPSFMKDFLRQLPTISEYKNGDYYINYFDRKIEHIDYHNWLIIDEIITDYSEIINRCRGLRTLSLDKAKEIIWQTCDYFIEFFKENRHIKYIYSIIVDTFIKDVMARIAQYFNVKVLGFVRFFADKDYYRLTLYGETNFVRNVDNNELDFIYNKIKSSSQSFMATSKDEKIRLSLLEYPKKKVKYLVTYLFKYKISNNLEWRNRFSDSLRGFTSIWQILPYFQFKAFDMFECDNKTIFIPLHVYPEGTIDYWVDDLEYVDYENSVLKVCSFLSSLGYTIIVKEHPAFVFARKNKFYNKLKKIPNVIIVDPFVNSKLIIDCVKKIVVWTGSAGLEGLVLNKQVYTVASNYYSFNLLPTYKNLSSEDFIYPSINSKEILKKVLEGTVRSK